MIQLFHDIQNMVYYMEKDGIEMSRMMVAMRTLKMEDYTTPMVPEGAHC